MPVLEEKYLRFEFADTWRVFQLDEHPSYRNSIAKLNGTKAVDFLGLHKNILYFIEVKDFKWYRIQNKKRVNSSELATEFGQKVKDSIACIIGSYRNPSYTDHYHDYFQKIKQCDSIKSILWLEHDLPRYSPQNNRAKSGTQSNIYKKKLRWLGSNSHVWVSNMENSALPETVVTRLSQPLP